MTSVTFSWLCAFLFQINPLIGPKLESNLIRVMQYEWMGIDPYHDQVSCLYISLYLNSEIFKINLFEWEN